MISLVSPYDGGPSPIPHFAVGQLVRHKRYGYRGVVVAFTPKFSGSEKWYQKNKTQPPKDQPWYHVLVDGSVSATYAAQTGLEPDDSKGMVHHPLVDFFFSSFEDGRYKRNNVPWDA
jgi:heat shock protein HspQ